MAIWLTTPRPTGLSQAIERFIVGGNSPTWSLLARRGYTHIGQYHGRAWFRPVIPEGERRLLVFGLTISKNEVAPRALYAIYHGRFIELLMAHFHADIEVLQPTIEVDEDYDNIPMDLDGD